MAALLIPPTRDKSCPPPTPEEEEALASGGFDDIDLKGLAKANDDLMNLMKTDPGLPKETRRRMEIDEERAREEELEKRRSKKDRERIEAEKAARVLPRDRTSWGEPRPAAPRTHRPRYAAKAKAQQAVHKEKERDAAETRKRTARKIASTQPLTMGTGPVPVDVGDVVEAYLYEKFYDSIDFIFVPPAGTKSRDLDVRVAAKTITVGLRGRPPCGASASWHGASEAEDAPRAGTSTGSSTASSTSTRRSGRSRTASSASSSRRPTRTRTGSTASRSTRTGGAPGELEKKCNLGRNVKKS